MGVASVQPWVPRRCSALARHVSWLVAARQPRAGPEVASLRDNFDILDADDSRRMLRRIMKAMNLSSDEDEGGKRDPVKIVAGHIGKFKDLLMAPKSTRNIKPV